MLTIDWRAALALAALAAAGADPGFAASAPAAAYCAAGAHRTAVRVPPELEAAVAEALGVTVDAAREAASVRCSGGRPMACWVGANLNCGKADTRRSLPGATAFCRAHPNSGAIPMVATGHATVYAWRCVAGRAIAGKPAAAVDAEGYAAGNWKELP